MAMKYLGNHFDIHTGGEDHIQVHHTNEIAQSEAATGEKFVNYWLHGSFLLSKGEKVSKSKGGLYTISELEENNYLPLSYRYMCFTAHYLSQLNFSLEALGQAQDSYARIKNIIASLEDDGKINNDYLKRFEERIDDDLDMPGALAILWELLRDQKADGKMKTIEKIDSVLGLSLLEKKHVNIPSEVQKLADERVSAKKSKDFKKSDELREQMKKLGYYVDDTPKGQLIKKL
jgi:cysteinyl-tRNA synthetase